MTREEYDAINAVNWSTAKHAAKSPLHYRQEVDHPREGTTRLDLGSAVHTAILEPDRFALEYCVFRGERRAGKAWDEFKAAHPHDTIILRVDEYEQVLAARDAVKAHPVAGPLIDGAKTEIGLTWEDLDTELPCKGRLDGLKVRTLFDLKTCRSVQVREFAAVCARMLYHGQMAFYRQGLLANGVNVEGVKIVAVEVEPPHDVAVFNLDDDTLWAGEEVVRAVLQSIAECRRRKEWPGRYAAEQELQLPAWAFPDTAADADDVLARLTAQEA